MRLCFARSGGIAALAGALALSAAACAGAPAAKTKAKPDASAEGDYERPGSPGGLPPPVPPDYEDEDAGVFAAPERKSTTTAPTDAGARSNGDGGDAPATDGGATGAPCAGPLKEGDLAIVEIMIRSVAGAGDRGEWIEVQSTRDCTLNLRGLKIQSPRGEAGIDGLTVETDLLLPPNRTIVVASSLAPSTNNYLPGVVLALPGDLSDVLKNDGDTIQLVANGVTVDSLTYPKFSTVEAGRSIAFPWDCAWSERGDWSRWSYSFYGWSGAFKGTPNSDNTDVACY